MSCVSFVHDEAGCLFFNAGISVPTETFVT